jgi:hypothetical protein
MSEIEITDNTFEFRTACWGISCSRRRGVICITVSDDSTGDTETGFGSECEISLDFDTAKKLGNWLAHINAERPRVQVNETKVHQVHETAPNDQQKQADGNQIP